MKRAIAIFFLLAATSCGPLRSAPTGETSYFPMSADRVWEYHFRHLESGDVWPVIVRSRGPGFVPALGRIAAIFDEDYPDQSVPVAFFLEEGFLQSEIGLRYRVERGVELMPIGIQPMRVMPMPPRVGMQWAYLEQVFGSTPDGATLNIRWTGSISREESVVVPAGVFRDCLRIESIAVHRLPMEPHPRAYRYVDWYAPNVGLVKNEYASGEDRQVFTRMELVSYLNDRDSPPAPSTPSNLVVAGLR
jgi:hypothetical protein